jgi:taurine dioxygenase
MTLTTTPTGASFGARVAGIDLREPPTPALVDEIRDLLHANQILIFSGQRLTQETLIAFSRHFGSLQLSVYDRFTDRGHPEVLVLSNVLQDGKPIGIDKFGRTWHTDLSYMARPTYATVLYAVEVPAVGGETNYASMVAAYEALEPERQAKLQGERFVHSLTRQHEIHFPKNFISDEQKARAPDVAHPVVRTHPVTGRKALYLGGEHIAFPEHLPYEAGHDHLMDLIRYATQPRFVYRHDWAVGDLVMWDNASVMHQATPFDGTLHRRVMYRTSIEGGVPV